MPNPERTPRIVMLSGEYPPAPGGVGDYTAHLADHLRRTGATVQVLTSSGPAQPDDGDVRRTITSWGRRLRSEVHAALQEWQADLLHIQYQTAAYRMRPAVNLLPSRLQIPVLVTFHDLRMPYLGPKMAPLRRYVTRLLLEGARRVVVTNVEDQARLLGTAQRPSDPDIYTLSRSLQPKPLLIPIGANISVTQGVDRAAVRAELGIAPDEIVVAYFGMLNRSKGVHTLLEALDTLPSRFRLLLIGGATTTPEDEEYAREIDALLAERNLEPRVLRTGYVAAARASALLQAADMAAAPFTEGAMYRRGSLLAMLAHGLPLVTTPAPMRLEPPLIDGVNVLFVGANQPGQLAEALNTLATSADLRATLAASAPHVAEAFSWTTIAQRHQALYRHILYERQ